MPSRLHPCWSEAKATHRLATWPKLYPLPFSATSLGWSDGGGLNTPSAAGSHRDILLACCVTPAASCCCIVLLHVCCLLSASLLPLNCHECADGCCCRHGERPPRAVPMLQRSRATLLPWAQAPLPAAARSSAGTHKRLLDDGCTKTRTPGVNALAGSA